MKIRTRDALVLANGIAGLLFYFQQARAADASGKGEQRWRPG